MPYLDLMTQRRYQRHWMARRRTAVITMLGGKCWACGSTERLELDHIDRTTKTTHRIYSWTTRKRKRELEKCQILCHACHAEKTRRERCPARDHGTWFAYREGCRCRWCRLARNEGSRYAGIMMAAAGIIIETAALRSTERSTARCV